MSMSRAGVVRRGIPQMVWSLMLLAMTTTACSGDAPATQPGMTYETATVTIKGKPFRLEIADEEAKITKGLMFRSTMPADQGMLFVFEQASPVSFWMKNTLIPLDIIFLDPQGRVLEVHKRRPLDETGMAPKDAAMFVIELNAGVAEAIGLKRGDAISLPEKYLKAGPASTEKKP